MAESQAVARLYPDASAPRRPASAERRMGVDALRAGTRLAQDIYDQEGMLLLAAESEITPRFLDLLAVRNIRTIVLHAGGPAEPARRHLASHLDSMLTGDSARSLGGAAFGRSTPRLSPDDLLGEAARGLEAHRAVSAMIEHVAPQLARGGSAAVGELRDAIEDFADRMALDRDLLGTILALHRPGEEYLFDHGVNNALLCMIIAARMDMTRDQVLEVGLGGLLADVGMLRVPRDLRLSEGSLAPIELAEVERHPLYGLDCLSNLTGLSPQSAIVAYQSHERCDGSGYPRRRHTLYIHPYARIAMIADTYAAMTRPRPYRPATLPYLAAETVLVESSDRRFDRDVVRAFLDCIGLFPIGSIVELTDGTRAKVLRPNPGLQTKPIVMKVRDDDAPTGDVLDLSKEDGLTIITALPPADWRMDE